ncbi:hypothetical protein ACJJTC_015660 [Scirpophaga incertulas]
MTIDEDMTCNNHEEADTKIIHHVCKLDICTKTNVLLKTSDTDVLIIMLGNMDHLQSDDLNIFMEYGTGNSKSSLTPNRNGWALNEDTLDFHWFDGDCIPQSVFDAVFHDNNKQNDIGNVIADDAEDDEADTDESEEDSDSSDEGASTDEE